MHQYVRKYIGKREDKLVYACTDPDCTHYLPPALVRGKRSICCQCTREMLLDDAALALMKPICQKCREGGHDTLDDVLERLLAAGAVPDRAPSGSD